MRILIVEDEQAAARRLEKMVRDILPEATLLGPLESVAETLEWLDEHGQPDLLLLDIHLADGSSFDIFNHIELQCALIFITAYDEYAIRAFRVNAMDYLLKPVKKQELTLSLRKVSDRGKQAFDYTELAAVLNQQNSARRYLVKIGQQIRLIETEDIAYVYTEDKITFLVTRDGRRFPVDYSLEKMEELLPQRQYFRINRQYIIGIRAIEEMLTYSKSRIKLILTPPAVDADIIVSTERSPHFKKWLVGED